MDSGAEVFHTRRSKSRPLAFLDQAGGPPVFEDGKTLDSYNASIEQIQTAAADQAKAQEELVRSMRAK